MKLIKTPIIVLLSILSIFLFLSLFLPSSVYGNSQGNEVFPFQNHLGYVVIVSDLHYPYGGKNVENVFATIIKIKPKYVFILGDLTEMGNKEEFKSVDKLLNILKKEKINYEVLLGNHDIRWSYNVLKRKVINGAIYENFRVDLEGITFIGVDTTLYFQHFGHIGDVQLRWIQEQISEYSEYSEYEKNLRDIIILSHHPFAGPANYTDDGWKLENIINKHNEKSVFGVIPLVLYGHVHTFGRSGLYNKTW
ncbi:MAG: metallophosphoesterase family protein, partial [Fervidobacterium sp.]